MFNVQNSLLQKKAVTLAKNAVGGRGESAAPDGGVGFADYAVVSLHCLRVYLEKSYRVALDLLSEMRNILGKISLDAADLPTTRRWSRRLTGSRRRCGECCCACRRSCTSPLATLRSTRRSSTAKTPAALLSPDKLPRLDAESERSRRYRNPGDPRRPLHNEETPRYTARLAGRPRCGGRPAQPRGRQRL